MTGEIDSTPGNVFTRISSENYAKVDRKKDLQKHGIVYRSDWWGR
jgi:hypothetical protein